MALRGSQSASQWTSAHIRKVAHTVGINVGPFVDTPGLMPYGLWATLYNIINTDITKLQWLLQAMPRKVSVEKFGFVKHDNLVYMYVSPLYHEL